MYWNHSSVSSEMETSVNILCACIFFSVIVTWFSQNYATEGYDVSNLSNNVAKPPKQDDLVTECETPNRDSGICVDIRQCGILLKQLSNKEAWSFMLASTCRAPSAANFYPKVCCGKYDNYRNMTKNTVGDPAPRKCGIHGVTIGRIVGGQPAHLGEFPWMAILLHKNENGQNILGCVGFLIDLQYIITAAHCTHPDSIRSRGPITSILLGEHNIETVEDCFDNICVKNTQVCDIANVTTHPGYDPFSVGRYNDIAIIKLKRPAQQTKYVKPICLLEDDTESSIEYYVCGWGRTGNASYSNIKMCVQLSPMTRLNCIEKYSPVGIYLNETQMCAGGKEMKDSCTGDSGGPLMVSNNNTWYAAGVVSFGIGCGVKGRPGVYTNLVKFLPWIKSQTSSD